MVASGGSRRASQGNLGGYIMVGQDKADRKAHALWDGSGYIGGRRAGGGIF